MSSQRSASLRGVSNVGVSRPAPLTLQGGRLMQLPPSFHALLPHFRPVLPAPSFRLFTLILTGWALSCRHRFLTACIFTAGQVGIGHWCRFHRCFAHYAWSLDDLCQVLARLLIRHFCATGPILLAGEDTLCRKRG